MDAAMTLPATLRDAVGAADRRIELPLAGAAARPSATAAQHQRYVLLTIAETHYAVPEACVTELERVPPITLVPRVPHWMRGVTNMRGEILSVIDMRSFLGLDAHTPASARMLVVRLLDESCAAGLLVDAVDRIVAVPAGDITAPASSLTGPLAPFLSGMFLIGERLVAVLDLDRLLRSPLIRQFDEPESAHAHH
jgi:purine-binding chemotaxis protein CheW